MFESCPNLQKVNFTNLNLSSIKDMGYLFYDCKSLTSIDFTNLDLSQIISMKEMFYSYKNVQKINFRNLNLSSLKTMTSLFYAFRNLISVDFKNLDLSQVTSMKEMFDSCTNLQKVNFGNNNISSLNIMDYLFYDCKSLTSVDFTNLDLSSVTSIKGMFYYCINLRKVNFENNNISSLQNMDSLFRSCYNLEFIDLSNFDTSKVTTMYRMFYNCSKLKYLDLSNFQTPKINSIQDMFSDCSSLIYVNFYSLVVEDETLISLIDLSGEGIYPLCERTPSYIKFCINDNELSRKLLKYKASYCSDICFKKNRKIDIYNNTCTDSCIKNGIKYEMNNICYTKCPKGSLVNNNICLDINCENNNYTSVECLSKIPLNYYYDPIDELFLKCFDSCKTCNGEGNESYHNCKECKTNFAFLNGTKGTINETNCYVICKYYYYLDDSNNFKCTDNDKCPENYNKLISKKKRCIDKCTNDDTYQYEYENNCLLSCPSETFYDENDKICHKSKFIETSISKEITQTQIELPETNKIFETDKDLPIIEIDERDNNLKEFRMNIINYNISENKEDKIEIINDVKYQITTTNNIKHNINNNESSLYFPICEVILKEKYDIDQSLPLILFKTESFPPNAIIPIIEYEIYHPINKSKLNLTYCEVGNQMRIIFPLKIDKEIFKYEPESEFYSDPCFPYSTEEGTDILLSDRKKEFNDKHLSLCEFNCIYKGYNIDKKQVTCECKIKNEMKQISEIYDNQIKLSFNFTEENIKENSGNLNIYTMKCLKVFFSKEGFKKNISSYIFIIFMIKFIVSIFLFFYHGYYLLENDIAY